MKRLITALVLATPLSAQEFGPVTDADYRPTDPALVALGRDLFYDPILSGNREVACATCHHPKHATADGVALGLGDGGIGLGPDRRIDPDNPPEQRIPRNAPALFNLGAREFTVMFHDGRLEEDAEQPGGIRTPIGADMVGGFASVLSAQTMFPVLSPDEMAGHYSENEIAQAVRMGRITGEGGAWDLLSARVAAVPAYADAFAAAGRPEIAFTDISDAIAQFMEAEWRADDSPFDRWLRSEAELPPQADAGRELFYGEAGCSTCHAGPFQTDHAFHAIAMPQLGPGKAARFEAHARDEGRGRVTGRADDAYAFRTPSLRNVAATAPYGHAGAYATLEGVIRHHRDPVSGFERYDRAQVRLIGGFEDWTLMDGPDAEAIPAANRLTPVALSDAQVADLIAFLEALTDETSIAGRSGIPETVPSGLPVPR
ncbi:cytochrome-c peroxidase [Pontivivens ytuae]|uniref:Cytochrome-c peroxidase n=1 Tax=Pontivivens ytuae TaxID=2789856 RepID=A0A7S9LPX1_9RHOB|nr:cytochrome c peroxidase [Pontivivens ytuae]QPH53068.1 cytochrome-c peroxidase [Pontivivens ytuae]